MRGRLPLLVRAIREVAVREPAVAGTWTLSVSGEVESTDVVYGVAPLLSVAS